MQFFILSLLSVCTGLSVPGIGEEGYSAAVSSLSDVLKNREDMYLKEFKDCLVNLNKS